MAMRKFARRWFGPYEVTSANHHGTYHLAELDGTRMAVPVEGKRVKAFKNDTRRNRIWRAWTAIMTSPDE